MNISHIPANLAPRLNFVLCHEWRAWELSVPLLRSDSWLFMYPEKEKHPNETVKWFLKTLGDRAYRATRPLVIATHAECLISVTGQLVMAGELEPTDVNLFTVDGNEATISYFNKDGALINWPFGWFMYDTDLVDTFIRENKAP